MNKEFHRSLEKISCTRFELLIVFLINIAASLFLICNATRRFDFFDMSAFLDAGYRVSIGQIPYLDFFYQAGPVHLYQHAISFLIFGFNKWAIFAHMLLLQFIANLIIWRLARLTLPQFFVYLILILNSICFFGPISHPWYDHSAAFWFLCCLPVLNTHFPNKLSLVQIFLLGLFCALAFLSKANIGLAAGLVVFVSILIRDFRFKTSLIFILSGLFSLFAVLYFSSVYEFFYQSFFAYKVANRLVDFSVFHKIWVSSDLIPILLSVVILLLIYCLRNKSNLYGEKLHNIWLCLGAAFVSFFGAYTGSMSYSAATVFHAVIILFLFRLYFSNFQKTKYLPNLYQVFSLLIFIIALKSSVLAAADLTAWNWKPSNLDSSYQIQNIALKGWSCNPSIGRDWDAALNFINQTVPENESLFVFPDSTVSYGILNKESYRATPFIFHYGQHPAPGVYYEKFLNHFKSSPPSWILLHHQTEVTFYDPQILLQWLNLDSILKDCYLSRWRQDSFEVFQIKSCDSLDSHLG